METKINYDAIQPDFSTVGMWLAFQEILVQQAKLAPHSENGTRLIKINFKKMINFRSNVVICMLCSKTYKAVNYCHNWSYLLV